MPDVRALDILLPRRDLSASTSPGSNDFYTLRSAPFVVMASQLSPISIWRIVLIGSRIKELVAAQPVEKGASERVRIFPLRTSPGSMTRRAGDHAGSAADDVEQHQEAPNPPIPLAQRHRPQVPTQSQTCPARHHEGTGMLPSARQTCNGGRRDTDDLLRRSSKKASGRSYERPRAMTERR